MKAIMRHSDIKLLCKYATVWISSMNVILPRDGYTSIGGNMRYMGVLCGYVVLSTIIKFVDIQRTLTLVVTHKGRTSQGLV